MVLDTDIQTATTATENTYSAAKTVNTPMGLAVDGEVMLSNSKSTIADSIAVDKANLINITTYHYTIVYKLKSARATFYTHNLMQICGGGDHPIKMYDVACNRQS